MSRYNHQDQLIQLEEEEANSQTENHHQHQKHNLIQPQFRSIQSKKILIYNEDEEDPHQKPLIQKKSQLRIVNTSSIERLKLNNFVQKNQQDQDNKLKRNKKRKIKIDKPEQKQFQFNPQILKKDSKKEEVKMFTRVQIKQEENKLNQQDNDDDNEKQAVQSLQSLQSDHTIQQNSNLLNDKQHIEAANNKQQLHPSDLKMIPSSSSKRFLLKLNQQMFDASNVQKNTMFNQKQEDDQYIVAKRKERLELLQIQKKEEKQKKQLLTLAPLKNQEKVEVMKRIKKEAAKEEEVMQNSNKDQLQKDLDQEAEYQRQLKKLLKKQKVKLRYADIAKSSLKQFCAQPISHGRFVQCKLKRDKSGLNMFFPQYNVFLNDSEEPYLISAKKNMGSYSISVSRDRFDQNSEYYIGFVQGNFTGSIYNICLQRSEDNFKENIATIVYDSQLTIGSVARKVQIYVKNQNLLYNQLDGVDVASSNTKNLCELYNQFQTNKTLGKITKFASKDPIYDPIRKQYGLNFGGKVTKPSVKNMIIINQQKPDQEAMVFGKTDDHDFYLKVCNPMSMIMVMGLLMTSFDFKLASQ